MGSFWHRFRVMSNIWNHKNLHFLGDLTQISCDVHSKSKTLNYDSGSFWHRFRVMSNIWNHKNLYLLGDLTQISYEVHLKSKKSKCYSGHFDTDFVWCPISEITKIVITACPRPRPDTQHTQPEQRQQPGLGSRQTLYLCAITSVNAKNQ